MSTGVVLNPRATAENAVDDIIGQARRAFEVGVRQVWLAQRFDYDAIALAGLVGAAVPGLGVGTFVVPINHLKKVSFFKSQQSPATEDVAVAPPTDLELLTEIRDLLAAAQRSSTGSHTVAAGADSPSNDVKSAPAVTID